MATQVTTQFVDTTSSDAIQSMFDKRLLMRGLYEHYAMMFVDKKSLGQRNGKRIIFRKYAALARNTNALTEGVTPTGKAKSVTDVYADVRGYGDWIENSDFLMGSQPEGVLDDVDQLSQQMGETMDALYYLSIWSQGTQEVFSNGASETSVNTLAVYEDYNKAVRLLRNNKAKRLTPMIPASQKIGTGGIMPGHWCLLSESMWYDIRAGSTFDNHMYLCSEYPSGGASIRGEVGALDIGVHFLPVPDADMLAGGMILANGGAAPDLNVVKSTGGSVADVHFAAIIGEQAAAGVDLGIGNGGIIRKALGSAGSADPLDQRATIGWKKYDGRCILDQLFFVSVRAGVSA